MSVITGYAKSKHHITDLRHGRKGQNPFDISLGEGNDRGKKGREGTNPGHDMQCKAILDKIIYRKQSCDKEYTCHNHSGSMDEC